jgi:hypothetical protein
VPDGAAEEIGAAVRGYFAGARAAAYGGLYLDRSDGTVVVLVTRDAARHLAAVRRLAPVWGALARVRTVRWSLAELVAAVAKVTGGDGFSTVAVDEQHNRVRVGLPADTPAARAAVLRRLAPGERAMVTFHAGTVELVAR